MAHNKKREVLVVTGTRAEYSYLRPVLNEIRKSKKLQLRLLVTGIHTLKKFGHTIDLIKKEGTPVACVVPVSEQDSMLQALAKEITGIERYCLAHRPDLMLVIADRDEAFAGAIVSGHLRIPLVHLSGGDTSGLGVDEPIRHSITKFAHLHFAWTPESGRRILAMGEEPWRVTVSGSTAFDTIERTPLKTRHQLVRELGLRESAPWLLVVQHPTPHDHTPLARQIAPTLKAVYARDAERILLYPNSDTGAPIFIQALKRLAGKPHTHIYESLPHHTYLSLLKHADVLVGNSSSGVSEAGFFHTPVVDIGNRQKGREAGRNVLHVPYDEKKIEQAIARALSPAFKRIAQRSRHPHYRGNASKKIVRALERLLIDEALVYKRVPMRGR